MTRTQIKVKLQDIIQEQSGVDINSVKLTSNLVEDFGLDSLDCVEIIMAVEDEFSLSIPNEEAEKVKTFEDAVNLIEKLTTTL